MATKIFEKITDNRSRVGLISILKLRRRRTTATAIFITFATRVLDGPDVRKICDRSLKRDSERVFRATGERPRPSRRTQQVTCRRTERTVHPDVNGVIAVRLRVRPESRNSGRRPMSLVYVAFRARFVRTRSDRGHRPAIPVGKQQKKNL